MSQSVAQEAGDVVTSIDPTNLVWVALAFAVMVAAIEGPSIWFLNFVHVMAGVLWTGIDLFMGFVLGPILRRVSLPARRAIICRLMPKMLFLMPTLSIITGTAGYFLAGRIGYLAVSYPAFWWVAAALGIVAILTVQGLGLLEPINLKIYFELRRPQPDGARIGRLMRFYVMGVAFQGSLQVAIILVMARFASGL